MLLAKTIIGIVLIDMWADALLKLRGDSDEEPV